jgi:mRNA interferase YafQ
MLDAIIPNRFQKDYILMIKRHKNIKKLDEIMALIALEEPLPLHCRPHILSGNLEGLWECHVENDWVLIYRINPIKKTVTFDRTGTHSDLL